MDRNMQFQLKMEELGMFLLSFWLFRFSELSWWWYAGLFFTPDLSFIAYALNTKWGAVFYNLLHHKAVALLIFSTGFMWNEPVVMAIGGVFFGHSSFDRILGYGLKYSDSFQNTHLGRIGRG